MPANSHPQANGDIDSWQTILILKISLTCGMSETVVSAAELTVVGNVQMNGTLNPTIQLWQWSKQSNSWWRRKMIKLRINSEECKMIPENEVNQMPGMDPTSGANLKASSAADSYTQSTADVFRCTVNFNEDLIVQSKDILGIELPPKQNTTFEIFFIENSTRRNYIILFSNYYETRPRTLNLINSTDTLQQPQINLRLKHPGKYVIVLSSVINDA